jgi:hypothetical protein
MHLPKLLTETLRLMRGALGDEGAPECDHCGTPKLLTNVIDQPVFNEPNRKLHQFQCSRCNTTFEELR